jgi:hypothetical protein
MIWRRHGLWSVTRNRWPELCIAARQLGSLAPALGWRRLTVMKLVRNPSALVVSLIAALLLAVTSAWALEPGADGYYHTGTGIRVKSIAFIDIKVYQVSHFMKQLPETKSKRAVIDMDVDKKISWTMLRDVDAEKVQNALREGYQKNGYSDGGKIGRFTGAFTQELKEKTGVNIVYNSANKTTTISVGGGGGTATVDGVDFMKATWSIWFGNIDQPKLGDAMISKIP